MVNTSRPYLLPVFITCVYIYIYIPPEWIDTHAYIYIYSYVYDYDTRLFTILYPFDTPLTKPGPTQLKLFMAWGADRRCLILGVLELFGKSGLGWKWPSPHLLTSDNLYLPIRNLRCPIFLCQHIGATARIYLPIPCDFCSQAAKAFRLALSGWERWKWGRFWGAPGGRSP